MNITMQRAALLTFCFSSLACGYAVPAHAEGGILKKLIEKRQSARNGQTGSTDGLNQKGENYQGRHPNDSFGGRDMVVYTPSHLPPAGQRSLVVVLHGGMGNALQIQGYLGLDPLADKYGFVVAYLNGTQVMGIGGENMRGWNAGECCGLPQRKNTDDVGYITGAINYITQKYGINRSQIYGMGHSNGAMMTQRLICETDLYTSAIPVSAPLEIDVVSCPPARGKRILAIHGAEDKNVPVEGGYGTDAINKKTNYNSQAYSKSVFDKSGADYQLLVLEGAAHNPETINAALIKTNGVTLPQTLVKFFGLDR